MSARPPTPQAIEARLDSLFDRLFRMTDAELRLLRLAWEQEDATERTEAWQRARAVAGQRRREDLIETARSTLAQWVNSYLSATAIEYGQFLINPGSGMNPTDVRRGAIPPVMDAVAAIVAGDELSTQDADVLLGPIDSLTPGVTERSWQ